jgi:hypothetical protein
MDHPKRENNKLIRTKGVFSKKKQKEGRADSDVKPFQSVDYFSVNMLVLYVPIPISSK